MTKSSREAQALEFVGIMKTLKEEPPRYCAMIAILGANVGFPYVEQSTAEYSAEDKAGALKVMDTMKKQHPELVEWIEKGIIFVRENWMQEATV